MLRQSNKSVLSTLDWWNMFILSKKSQIFYVSNIKVVKDKIRFGIQGHPPSTFLDGVLPDRSAYNACLEILGIANRYQHGPNSLKSIKRIVQVKGCKPLNPLDPTKT